MFPCTEKWFAAAALAWQVPADLFEQVISPKRQRATAALARFKTQLAGQSIFFFPDSQLEIPLARFLHRELDMVLTEVGVPYLHRQHMASELALLPEGVQLSEGQDVERQLDRCRAIKPDLVVSSPAKRALDTCRILMKILEISKDILQIKNIKNIL